MQELKLFCIMQLEGNMHHIITASIDPNDDEEIRIPMFVVLDTVGEAMRK
jgi:hypothetical protein